MTTRKIFIALIILNILVGIIGLVSFEFGISEIVIVAILPLIWLWIAMEKLGLPVTDGGGIISTPNAFGMTLILVGTLLSLVLYYSIAKMISRRFNNL